MECSICNGSIAITMTSPKDTCFQGHNAEPVNDGRCCSACNTTVVIPARMRWVFDSLTVSSIREVRNKLKEVGLGGLTADEKAILQSPLLK